MSLGRAVLTSSLIFESSETRGSSMSMKTSFGIYQKKVDQLFDAPAGEEFANPGDGRFLFIVFSHRSGSNLLAGSLETNGIARKALAPFSDRELAVVAKRTSTFADACQHIAGTDSGTYPFFAMKVGWRALLHLATCGAFGQTFGTAQSHLLWIDRGDKLRQAVSYVKAAQSEQWYDFTPPTSDETGASSPPSADSPTYEFDGRRLLRREHKFAMASKITNRTLAALDLPVHRVLYEDFVANPGATLSGISKFLELPPAPPIAQTMFTKQSNELNDRWYDRATAFKAKPAGQKLLARLEDKGAEDLAYFDRVIADIAPLGT